MKSLLNLYAAILRAPDDGGGSGGDSSAANGGNNADAGDTGQGSAPAGTPSAEGGNGQPADPSAAQVYRPDGLDDSLLGQNDQETIDKMAKALADGRGVVPEKAEGYMDFSNVEVADNLKPYISALSEDPVFKAVGDWAFGKKMDQGLMQEGLMVAYGAAAEGGFLSPMVDQAAEEKKLVPANLASATPDQQAAAAKARVDAAEGYINLAIQNGTLPKGVGENAALMLLDTAEGVQFLEWVQSRQNAAAPSGAGDGGTGADEREQLKAELAKPEMQSSHPKFDRKKHADLQARYKKVIGGN